VKVKIENVSMPELRRKLVLLNVLLCLNELF